MPDTSDTTDPCGLVAGPRDSGDIQLTRANWDLLTTRAQTQFGGDLAACATALLTVALNAAPPVFEGPQVRQVIDNRAVVEAAVGGSRSVVPVAALVAFLDGYDEQVDGPDAADAFVKLRRYLSLPPS